jgi:hypothetical protein
MDCLSTIEHTPVSLVFSIVHNMMKTLRLAYSGHIIFNNLFILTGISYAYNNIHFDMFNTDFEKIQKS